MKRIITDQKDEIEKKLNEEDIIEREGLDEMGKYLVRPNILAIIGPRRSGKSVFSMLLSRRLGETACYVNFDDERLMGAKASDLDRILQASYELYGKTNLIILDEIQNVDGWELFANRLRRTKKVIITGSNSRLLSGELATHLTGRYIDYTLYPFSFKETLGSKPNPYLTEDVAKTRRRLSEYTQGSGFPEYRLFGPGIVVRTYGDVIGKDCIRRHKIRNEATFRELANYLVSNYSKEFTYTKLTRIFDLGNVHTTKNYVTYLREAFLITVLERFSPKLKQQILAPKKAYAIDQGLCNFVSFNLTKDTGRLYENIVCTELLRRNPPTNGTRVYYWRDPTHEVDFLIKDGRKVKQLIQVCYDPTDQDTKNREEKALIKASKQLRCDDLTIITDNKDDKETINHKKIKYTPLWKWLLQTKAKTT